MDIKKKHLEKQRDLSACNVTPPFPRIIKIDTCNVCNYRCIFCPQAKQINKIGSIDDVLCRRIIKDAYDAGARELCVSATGEPLINPRLEEYIAYAKQLGYEYVFFNTNGYLLDHERSVRLLDSGIDSVKISINAGRKSYALIHGVDAYDKVLENLREFDRLRRERHSNCKVYVSYVAVKQTTEEIEEVRKAVEGITDSFMSMNANNRGGSADAVTDEIYGGDDDFSFQYPCSQLFNNVYITSEGYMVACCQDFENNMVIADLHEISVAEAWNCEAFVSLRSRYLKGDIKGILCENCIHNTHNPVTPLNTKYAGYDISEDRTKDLHARIAQLIKR